MDIDESEQGKPYIHLNQGEYGVFKGSAIIDSGGMGECISVFILNKKQKKAIAGHFDAVSLSNYYLEDMIKKSKKVFSNRSELEAYVGGSAPDSQKDNEYFNSLAAERNYVVNKLNKAGFRKHKLKIRWGQADSIVAMILDLDTGEMEFETNHATRNNIKEDDSEEPSDCFDYNPIIEKF